MTEKSFSAVALVLAGACAGCSGDIRQPVRAPEPSACLQLAADERGMYLEPSPPLVVEGFRGARVELRGGAAHPLGGEVVRVAFAIDGGRESTIEGHLDRQTMRVELPELRPGRYHITIHQGEASRTADFIVAHGRLTYVAIYLVGPSGWGRQFAGDASPLRGGDLLRYRRHGCHGDCPVFEVRLRADGRLTWRGRRHVSAKGLRVRKLDEAELAATRSWLRCLEPFPSYQGSISSGAERLDMVYTVEGGQHEFVVHETYIPTAVRRILDAIDEELGLRRWIER